MKFILALVIAAVSAVAADKSKTAPAAAIPLLTDPQKAAIAMALYDSESLNPARAAIAKAEQSLRVALQACGPDFIVGRDTETHELKCIAPPKAAASPVPSK